MFQIQSQKKDREGLQGVFSEVQGWLRLLGPCPGGLCKPPPTPSLAESYFQARESGTPPALARQSTARPCLSLLKRF